MNNVDYRCCLYDENVKLVDGPVVATFRKDKSTRQWRHMQGKIITGGSVWREIEVPSAFSHVMFSPRFLVENTKFTLHIFCGWMGG